MKNSIFILISVLIALSCKAQIIPLEQHHTYGEIPDGAHVKDVNNILGKFFGTWTGTFNDKTFYFYVSEYTETVSHSQFDILQIRYKVLDANGNIEHDTTSPTIEEEYIISGYYFQDDGLFETYVLDYIGLGCGQGGDLYITVRDSAPNEMVVHLYSYGEIPFIGCPNGVEDEIFPIINEFMTLIKQ